MKRVLSIVRNIIFVVTVVAICSMIFIMSSGKHISINGYQVLRVLTGSMAPTIPENTCIIIRKVDTSTLKVGDIITFTSDDPNIMGYYNTHRIERMEEQNGTKVFITKGDAVDAEDAYPVRMEQVAGTYVRELPGGRLLGRFFVALSDSRIYFLFVMLPLALCLISYFWQIVGVVHGRYEEEEDEENEDEEE